MAPLQCVSTKLLALLEISTLLSVMIFVTATVTALDSKQEALMVIDSVKAGAEDVSLFLTTRNVTSVQVTASMRKSGATNVTTLEIFQIPTTTDTTPDSLHDQNIVHHAKHTMSKLEPDTEYEMCVSASDIQREGTPPIFEGCYRVTTLPKADNVTGIYAALIAVAIFIATVVFIWGIYKKFLQNRLSELFTIKPRIISPAPPPQQQFNGALESQDIQGA